MTDYPLKRTADELASKGRYGDTMLVHMNPAEVEGIASITPGGKLTINPETGQPEAFLPFLVPLLGSMAGTTLLPGLASAAGVGLSSAVGGAIGSGLATWAQTGDLEKGLMSGLMGYGVGNALGAAGAAGQGAAQGVSEVAVPEVAKRAGTEALSEGAKSAALEAVKQPTMSAALQQAPGNLAQSFSNPGALAKAAMSPGSMIPAATGAGMLAEEERLEAYRDAQNAQALAGREDRMAEQEFFDRNLRYSQQSFPGTGNPYAPQGYADGGITSVHPEDYAAMRAEAMRFVNGGPTFAEGGKAPALFNQGYGLPGGGGVGFNQGYGLPGGSLPASRQESLRGPFVNAPPEEYRPGIDPEFLYFSQEPTPTTTNPPAPQPDVPDVPVNPLGDIPSEVRSRYELLIGPTDLPGKNARQQPDFRSEVASLRDQYPSLYMVDERLGDRIHRDTPRWRDYGGIDANAYQPPGPERSIPTPVGGPGEIVAPYGIPEGGIAALRGPRNAMRFAEGGRTPDTGDLEMVTLAIRGETDGAEEIIESFTQKYGPETFAAVREQVLNSVTPGAQTEGMLEGDGGGMDDGIAALIGSSQPAAVSPGEYIIPADVVSGLGDGSSDAGADRLEELIARVRQSRTGTKEQPKPVDEQQVMPA